MSCLQYYYESEEDRKKYNISCHEKHFENLNSVENFTNKDLLDFISKEYSSTAFPNLGEENTSPFEFDANYINESHESICNAAVFNLAPQQKFVGQFVNPMTNFNNALIYHGLGSGKTCTSLVIGEAFKNTTRQRLLYVVPAALIDQYFEEIIGELRANNLWSCTSQCVIRRGGADPERDFYISKNMASVLTDKMKKLTNARKKLYDLQEMIDSGNEDKSLISEYLKQETAVKSSMVELTQYQQQLKAETVKVFEITSHQMFINELYDTGKNGQLLKKERLLFDNVLLNENGVLIIDEIQRLVSAGGIFYKKLYNAVKYYFHPKLRFILMSATPIYDNPYELALTINLLRPRVPFPIKKEEFYKYFVGEYSEEEKKCVKGADKDWISDKSCPLNQDMIAYLCSGYVSYFRGGNPNAYPYKRVITLEHTFLSTHKTEYISALESDIKKDKNFKKKGGDIVYDNVVIGNYDTAEDDKISGIYVTTQQYSNIALPKGSADLNLTLLSKKNALVQFKTELDAQKFTSSNQVTEYITLKGYSKKFSSIISLSVNCDGPVFIFSNWLMYGVEPLGILLEACGYVRFPKNGPKRYFIWSSETKTTVGPEIIKSARNTFNSTDNKDGSLLHIMLGTRSVMEGVSFKNVKQVHITEPWWNEARIEQILARAVRFCSHTALPLNQQYVDIYRHYSVLPNNLEPDTDVVKMLNKSGKKFFRGFETFSIDQQMAMISMRKARINSEFENILKSAAIDCVLNKNGNLVRLEEYSRPLPSGNYQIYFRDPGTYRNYIRAGIPVEGVTFNELYERKYSFPNDSELEIKFIEAGPGESGFFVPYPDSKIIESPQINKQLIIPENILPWNSSKKFGDITDDMELFGYLNNLRKNYLWLQPVRKKYFVDDKKLDIMPKKLDTAKLSLVKTKHIYPQDKKKIIDCIKYLATANLVSEQVKKSIFKTFQVDKNKEVMDAKVIDIIFKFELFPKEWIQDLYDMSITDPETINDFWETGKQKQIELSKKSK